MKELTMISDRRNKVIRMKLQTAKVLWQEKRKDAVFLLLESIDDPRGDALREQMGFSEDYDVGLAVKPGNFSRTQAFSLVTIVAVFFFILGYVISWDGGGDSTQASVTENQELATFVAPTPLPGDDLSQVPIDITATATSGQPTVAAMQTQQNSIAVQIELSETARYLQSTATADARQTDAAR